MKETRLHQDGRFLELIDVEVDKVRRLRPATKGTPLLTEQEVSRSFRSLFSSKEEVGCEGKARFATV